MARYIIRRVFQAIPLLIIISFVLFAFTNSLGDPTAVFAESRQRPTAAEREAMRIRLGLDRPVYEQYIIWLFGNDWMLVDASGTGGELTPGTREGVLRGDLGISFVTRQPAWTRIEERLPATLMLMIPAYVITLILALVIGVYSATHQYTFIDNLISGVAFFLFSMPIFFIALLTIYLLSVIPSRLDLPWLAWEGLPIGGTGNGSFGDLLVHMIMPVFCLVSIQLAGYVRFIRSSMVEVLQQDYIRTAHAKGLSDRGVVQRHALKNAALPLITLIGLDLPFLLAGAVVTERIFAWPGMGRLFIESFERADIPVMMSVLMLLCLLVVFFQIATDIVYTLFDPRIRY